MSWDDSNYFFTREAQVIPTTTGTISALSSLLVISIILRSQHSDCENDKQNNPDVNRFGRKFFPPFSMSTYHLVMFFFSFWDIISSIAIALTTIPMPADVHETYPFASDAYGNAGTCKTQSFLIMMGQSFAICSYIALSVFYLCSVRYGMTEATMKKKLLPAMLSVSCALSIPVTIAALASGVLNPSPMLPYCTIGVDPSRCKNEGGIEINDENCDDTQERATSSTRTAIGFLNVIMLIMMIVCLILILLTVAETKLTALRAKAEQENTDHAVKNGIAGLQDIIYDDENGTVISRAISGTAITFSTAASSRYSTSGARANEMLDDSSCCRNRPQDMDETMQFFLSLSLMYIASFFLTWIPTIISICSRSSVRTSTLWRINHRFELVFSPLQGFFNLLIFLYDKVNLLKGGDLCGKEALKTFSAGDEGDRMELSSFQALKIAICSPSYIPEVFVSSIDKDRQEQNVRRQERVEQELMSMRRPGTENFSTSHSTTCAERCPSKDISSETRLYYEVPPELLRPSFVRFAGSPLSSSSSSKQDIHHDPSHSTGFFPRLQAEEGETEKVDDNTTAIRHTIWDPNRAGQGIIHPTSNNQDSDNIFDDNSSGVSSGSNSTIRRLSFTLHSLLGGFSGALSPIMEIGINENGMEVVEAVEGDDEELSFASSLEA